MHKVSLPPSVNSPVTYLLQAYSKASGKVMKGRPIRSTLSFSKDTMAIGTACIKLAGGGLDSGRFLGF
jgi:hypothetical protein